jgi:hypothetical protein
MLPGGLIRTLSGQPILPRLRKGKSMKLVTNLLAVTCLTMSGVSWAQKADGYAWEPNDNLRPGIYQARVDAKVYFDIDKKAIEKGVIVKKGTRISVYSAGYHSAQPPSIDWFNLSEGQECNGKVLAWDKFGWIGVLKKDFTRVGDLPKPIYIYEAGVGVKKNFESSPASPRPVGLKATRCEYSG